jgi:hypothetical protein
MFWAVVSLLDSSFSPPADLQRLMLGAELIYILNSSHELFHSILDTIAAQLGQLHPQGGPSAPESLFNKALWYCCGFLFPVYSFSPNSIQKYLLLLAFSFIFFFFFNCASVLTSVWKRYNMLERRRVLFLGQFFYSCFLFWPVLLFMLLWPRYLGGQLPS